MTTQQILERAKVVKAQSFTLTTEQKNRALLAMANEIINSSERILAANRVDVEEAKTKFSAVMLDRLSLDERRIGGMVEGIKQVASLADPVGNVLDKYVRSDGLVIQKVSVPIGVVAIIYESRPNVTADAAALCLKSGNACVLRSGKEAHRTSYAVVEAMKRGLESVGLPSDLIQLIDDTSRESAQYLMQAVGYVDLLIPRGGAGLISACVENAKVPCIQTGTGICHIYVDESANLSMATKIIENAKVSRPSVCNAMEVCLVNEKIKDKFLPQLWECLVKNRQQNKVELRLDKRAYEVLKGRENCIEAKEGDFDTEFLDYKMAVKVVKNVDEAISHIAKHSTHHSDGIVTEDKNSSKKFCLAVDSAAVYVNASTRFTDGGEFGLGCEMGISTQKLHARGPMGLKELTTYKYLIEGAGHIRI